ncbi:hypothetical protein [Roseicyclus persicicus]|uniref:Uncharacterized protein n=1 Tax=Roseicyclus persicicus TaxID=2650661 RepID=A0A7X6JZD7_9RHOB|nr:hypothetical protein [Roseibacterium persicicum]NKX44698.1 hypothetical protein [Roseibacterium persicicum]
MAVAAGIVGALMALLLAAALLPWHLRVEATTAPPRLRLSLRLLAGIAPAIPLAPGGPRTRRPAPRRTRRPPSLHRLQGTGRLVAALLGAVGLRRLRLSGRFGLDDPADTGALYGLVQTARASGAALDLAPDFSGPCLDLAAEGTLILRPARVAAALIRFGWTNRGALWP